MMTHLPEPVSEQDIMEMFRSLNFFFSKLRSVQQDPRALTYIALCANIIQGNFKITMAHFNELISHM